MSENTLNQALRRMGYSKEQMTSHGWRTTATSLLNESGHWNADVVERSLAHGDPDAIRGVYNRTDYFDERRKMHQWWSDYLDELRDGAVMRPFNFPKSRPDPAGAQSNITDLAQERANRNAA